MTEQLTEHFCVLVNGHAVEPGCWVEGSWGQYGPDHLADRATEIGWEPVDWGADPRQIRSIVERIEYWGYPRDCADVQSEGVGIIATFWELHIEAADRIEVWLNEHTEPDGYSWGWYDGEFYLWPTETWEESSSAGRSHRGPSVADVDPCWPALATG